MTAGRTLVAGVGNVFLRDDGFGVEVARLLAGRPHPAGVEIADFGIRGVHLVYELLDGCDLFVLVDAAPRGGEPGTVTVLEVGPDDAAPCPPVMGPPVTGAPVMDGHGLTPDDIFAMLATMGGRPGRSLLVACEPADVSEGMGLSEPVRAALPHAVHAVEEILGQLEIGQKEGVRDGAQADHGGGHSGTDLPGGGRAAGH
jgi:hydrogenase maturation protease